MNLFFFDFISYCNFIYVIWSNLPKVIFHVHSQSMGSKGKGKESRI